MRNDDRGPRRCRFWIGACAVWALAAALANAAEGAAPDTQFDIERAPWPCFRGPYGNGSAPVYGLKLVEDLDDARLVWESEEVLPPSSPWRQAKDSPWQQRVWSGGYCSPIVAEGRVFLACWRPAGRSGWKWTEEDDKFRSTDAWFKRIYNPVGGHRENAPADDILYCIDASTGKTVWRAVLAGKGRNIPGYFEGAHMVCTWWDGAVFFPGTGRLLYAVDAASGRRLWEAPIKRREKRGPRECQTAAAAVSGVVVACGEDTLAGFDCRTGKPLWGGISKGVYAVPVPWQHQDEAYFVVSGKLIEARTGKVRWEIPAPSERTVGDSVCREYLVMSHRNAADDKLGKQGLTCFRISPEGFEELWHHPWGYKINTNRITTTIISNGLVYGMVTKDGTPGVACLGLASGRHPNGFVRLRWGYAPLAAEGRVINCHCDTLYYLHADPSRFGTDPVRFRKRPGRSPGWAISQCTSPAYAKGFLYFRQTKADGHARLMCYDLRRGSAHCGEVD